MYKNEIVWAQERNGNKDIYLYDVIAGQEKRITSHAAIQEGPAINDKYIAWIDYASGRGQVVLYDKTTKQSRVVAPSAGAQIRVAMSNKYIAWIEALPVASGVVSPAFVKVYDFEKNVVFQVNDVSKGIMIPSFVNVSNDLVVWLENVMPNKYRIKIFDLNAKRMIGYDGLYADYVANMPPTVSGKRVVWTELNVYYDLVMFDAQTFEKTYLMKDTLAQVMPSLRDDHLIWLEAYDQAKGPHQLKMLDLSTGRMSHVVFPIQSKKYTPSIHGDTIAWVDERSGTQSLYVMKAGALPKVKLTINKTGDKDAKDVLEVNSNPLGIQCGNQCVMTVDKGTKVTLSIKRLDGTKGNFDGWNINGCVADKPCAVTINKDETLNLKFTSNVVK